MSYDFWYGVAATLGGLVLFNFAVLILLYVTSRRVPLSPEDAESIAVAEVKKWVADPEADLDDADKLALIERWLHPGLWSGLDGRREALLRIVRGEAVEPPEWSVP